MNDAELVGKARAGDTAAFGAVVARHQHLVIAVALAITGDRARAEDAAQDAFVTAWKTLTTLKEEARVGSWIAGIARHRALDLVRGKAARDSASSAARTARPPDEGGSYHEPPTTEPSPLEHLLDAEEHILVRDALAALPDAQRETVILHYFEGQSVRAVAAALDVSEDTVKQRLHRARATLRDRVADRLGTALEHARPTAAFATAVVAAIGTLTVATTATAAATKGAALMTTKQLVVGLSALVLASGAAFVALRDRGSVHPGRGLALPSRGATSGSSLPSPAPPPAPPTTARKKLDPAARAQLANAIRTARTRRLASLPHPTPQAHTSSAPVSGASLTGSDDVDQDRAVIRASMQEILPLVRECYESALERTPTLAGTLVVKFTIEGEPEVGGLIGDSTIDPETSTLLDADTHECVRESMYALELPAPTAGGVVNVTYPFTFSTGDDDEGAAPTPAPTPPPAR